MSQTGVVSWSKTSASNASADSNVNWAEGQAPSSVNDSARAEMASVAKYRDDTAGSLTTGGTSTAYTLTTNQVFSSLTVLNGQSLRVRFNATNGASPTLNVDTLGAKAIQIDASTAVPTGGILADQIWDVTYDNSIPAFIVNGYPQVVGDIDVVGTATIATADVTDLTVSGTFGFTLPGASISYGSIINGTITESNSSNAATFALKTLAGNDPSSADPVIVAFRNATAATGNYVYRQITGALSLTISSGSKIGTSNSTPFRIWLVLFDDGGTIRMGAINCLSGTNIYALGKLPLASSTAEGGSGAADSAQVFYTGTAVSSKPYVVLGYAEYGSGLSVAGTWNSDPTYLQLYGFGVPLPGETIHSSFTGTGAVSTGTTALPNDDTIPQNTEGTEFMSLSITPVSAANVLRVNAQGYFQSNQATSILGSALFQDSTANAVAAIKRSSGTNGSGSAHQLDYETLANTTSSTTFKVRAGDPSGNTVTFNGDASSRVFGGVMNSYMRIEEIMS